MKLVLSSLDADLTLRYLNRKLNGSGYFANSISQANLLANGLFYALAIPGVSPGVLHDFDTGGLIFPPPAGDDITYGDGYRIEMVTNHGQEILTKSVERFLNARPDHFALQEDFLASPTDPWVAREQPEYYLAGPTMQYILWHGADLPKIEEFLGETVSFLAVVILGCAKMEMPSSAAQLDEATLRAIQSGIKMIFVGIYDGESYLVWIKNGEYDLLAMLSDVLAT